MGGGAIQTYGDIGNQNFPIHFYYGEI